MDIVDASMDPLVRSVRHQLRTKFNVTSGVECLLSMEKPRCGLVATEEQAAAPSMLDYQVCRRSMPPSRVQVRRSIHMRTLTNGPNNSGIYLSVGT